MKTPMDQILLHYPNEEHEYVKGKILDLLQQVGIQWRPTLLEFLSKVIRYDTTLSNLPKWINYFKIKARKSDPATLLDDTDTALQMIYLLRSLDIIRRWEE